ncbi:MAG: hypothetical protein U0903_19105 [Planctomycetales bacterium]
MRIVIGCVICLFAGEVTFGAESAVAWRLAGVGLEGDQYAVAYIATADQIVLVHGKENDWKVDRLKVPQGKLVPGGALLLRKATGKDETPHIGTIGVDGRLWEIWGHPSGVKVRHPIPYPARFPAGGDFSVVEADIGLLFFGIDKEGRFHEMDLSQKKDVIVEGRPDVLLPGSPVRTLGKDGNRVYLVDTRGNLVVYVRDPLTQWTPPQLIGTGFRAGGDIAIWKRPDGARETMLASINGRGEPKYAREENGNWRVDVAPGWVLPPGSSLDVFHTPGDLRLFGVSREGKFLEMDLLNTEWRERIISPGYVRGSLVHLPTREFEAFAVDAGGDIVAAKHAEGKWNTYLIPAEGGDEKGAIKEREWKLDEKKERRDVALANRSNEELIVRIRDLRQPADRKDYVLKGNSETTVKLDLGAHGTIVTRLTKVVGQGKEAKSTEITRTRGCGAETLYDVEVLKRGMGIAYQDVRIKRSPQMKGGTPTEISLGSFPLVEEKSLPKGGAIDVVKSAHARHAVAGK